VTGSKHCGEERSNGQTYLPDENSAQTEFQAFGTSAAWLSPQLFTVHRRG